MLTPLSVFIQLKYLIENKENLKYIQILHVFETCMEIIVIVQNIFNITRMNTYKLNVVYIFFYAHTIKPFF